MTKQLTDFVATLGIAQDVLEKYKRDWPSYFKKIDGTPIPNDLCCRMAEAFRDALNSAHDAAMGERNARIKELEAQLAGLIEFNASAREGEPWQANAQFKGEAIKAWAIGMVDCFKGEGATNYLTCELIDPRDHTRYEVSMQRCGGKTPAQALNEATAERDTLSAENAALRNLANNLQPGPISEAMAGTRYTREAELSAELEKARAVMEDCASDLEYQSADASDLPVVARKLRMYLSTAQPGNGREVAP